MSRARSATTLAALSLLVSGTSCSLALDLQLDCVESTDCEEDSNGNLLACVSGSCEPTTCAVDDDCDGLGDGPICSGGMCVEGGCTEDADCEALDDPEHSVCRNQTCVADGSCRTNADCRGQLETPGEPVCNDDGVCEDPTWGCVGRQDPREPMGDRASFQIQVHDLLQLIPSRVEVEACLPADTDCRAPRNITVEYDSDTGLLELSGKELQDFGGYLLMHSWAPNGVPYMDARFPFVTRRLLNEEHPEDAAIMVLASTVPMLGERGGIEDAEAERGIILSRVYDCQGRPAEGVTITSDDSGLADDAVIFYVLNEEYDLSQDVSETTEVGVAGIANVLQQTETPDLSINLQALVDDTLIVPQFPAVMQPGGVTHVWIYPGYE